MMKTRCHVYLNELRRMTANYPEYVLSALLSIVVIITSLTVVCIFSQYEKKQALQYAYKNTLFMAQYLGIMNQFFIETNQLHHVKCFPVIQEPGVVSCSIVNHKGKILASHGNIDHTAIASTLYRTMQHGQSFSESYDKDMIRIIYPMKKFSRCLGAVILERNISSMSTIIITKSMGPIFLCLLVYIIFCTKIGKFVVISLLRPFQELDESVRIAIKQHQENITIHHNLVEINDLACAFNHLLKNNRY